MGCLYTLLYPSGLRVPRVNALMWVCHSFAKGFGATVCLVLGETLWSHPSSFSGNASILSPLLQVPDINGDGTPDLLILAQEGQEVISIVLKYSRPTHLQDPSLLPHPLLPKENLCDHPQWVLPGLCVLRSTHAPYRDAPPLQAAGWPSP